MSNHAELLAAMAVVRSAGPAVALDAALFRQLSPQDPAVGQQAPQDVAETLAHLLALDSGAVAFVSFGVVSGAGPGHHDRLSCPAPVMGLCWRSTLRTRSSRARE